MSKFFEAEQCNHLVDLDIPNGNEYVLAGDTLLSDVNFWVRFSQEEKLVHLYNQLEFAEEYGNCLCTLYGALQVISMMTGVEITKEQRLELVKLRVAQSDFQRDVGGWVTVGVDVVRNWWNKTYPNDKALSFMVSDKGIRTKLLQKSIPVVRSMRGNRIFTLDTKDGVLDVLDYQGKGLKMYGHCTGMERLRILDNYGRTYSYKTMDDYFKQQDQAIESKNGFIFVRESDLSEDGKMALQAMRAKMWNGERPNDNLTRSECVSIAKTMHLLLYGTKILDKSLWDGKRGNDPVTRYEMSVIFRRALKDIAPLYKGTDLNTFITRLDGVINAVKAMLYVKK